MTAIMIYMNMTQKFADEMTVRNILSPSGEYSVPWETHGGTVYLDRKESIIVNSDFPALFGILAIFVTISGVLAKVLNLKFPPNKKRTYLRM